MKFITMYTRKERTFAIVRHDGRYCAIEDKYIDADGKLTKTLNGLQMYASISYDECVEHVKNTIDIDDMIANGYTRAQALVKVYNLDPSMIEVLEKVI